MRFSNRPAAMLISISLLLVAPSLHAGRKQKSSKNATEDRILAARALYYTPTAKGLRAFSCDVSIDWKDLLTRFSGKVIDEDNAYLRYLESTRLSISDNLKSGGKFEWDDTAKPTEAISEAAGKMHRGFEQTFSGFFSTWNSYMNGTMVPAPDRSTTVTATADGLMMHAESSKFVVDEEFDKNLLLTKAHVVTTETDATAYPTYKDSPEGRIVTTIRTDYRQPPTAPPTELTMNVDYATVQGFQLPQTLRVSVQNVGAFVFHFLACNTNMDEKAPSLP